MVEEAEPIIQEVDNIELAQAAADQQPVQRQFESLAQTRARQQEEEAPTQRVHAQLQGPPRNRHAVNEGSAVDQQVTELSREYGKFAGTFAKDVRDLALALPEEFEESQLTNRVDDLNQLADILGGRGGQLSFADITKLLGTIDRTASLIQTKFLAVERTIIRIQREKTSKIDNLSEAFVQIEDREQILAESRDAVDVFVVSRVSFDEHAQNIANEIRSFIQGRSGIIQTHDDLDQAQQILEAMQESYIAAQGFVGNAQSVINERGVAIRAQETLDRTIESMRHGVREGGTVIDPGVLQTEDPDLAIDFELGANNQRHLSELNTVNENATGLLNQLPPADQFMFHMGQLPQVQLNSADPMLSSEQIRAVSNLNQFIVDDQNIERRKNEVLEFKHAQEQKVLKKTPIVKIDQAANFIRFAVNTINYPDKQQLLEGSEYRDLADKFAVELPEDTSGNIKRLINQGDHGEANKRLFGEAIGALSTRLNVASRDLRAAQFYYVLESLETAKLDDTVAHFRKFGQAEPENFDFFKAAVVLVKDRKDSKLKDAAQLFADMHGDRPIEDVSQFQEKFEALPLMSQNQLTNQLDKNQMRSFVKEFGSALGGRRKEAVATTEKEETRVKFLKPTEKAITRLSTSARAAKTFKDSRTRVEKIINAKRTLGTKNATLKQEAVSDANQLLDGMIKTGAAEATPEQLKQYAEIQAKNVEGQRQEEFARQEERFRLGQEVNQHYNRMDTEFQQQAIKHTQALQHSEGLLEQLKSKHAAKELKLESQLNTKAQSMADLERTTREDIAQGKEDAKELKKKVKEVKRLEKEEEKLQKLTPEHDEAKKLLALRKTEVKELERKNKESEDIKKGQAKELERFTAGSLTALSATTPFFVDRAPEDRKRLIKQFAAEHKAPVTRIQEFLGLEQPDRPRHRILNSAQETMDVFRTQFVEMAEEELKNVQDDYDSYVASTGQSAKLLAQMGNVRFTEVDRALTVAKNQYASYRFARNCANDVDKILAPILKSDRDPKFQRLLELSDEHLTHRDSWRDRVDGANENGTFITETEKKLFKDRSKELGKLYGDVFVEQRTDLTEFDKESIKRKIVKMFERDPDHYLSMRQSGITQQDLDQVAAGIFKSFVAQTSQGDFSKMFLKGGLDKMGKDVNGVVKRFIKLLTPSLAQAYSELAGQSLETVQEMDPMQLFKDFLSEKGQRKLKTHRLVATIGSTNGKSAEQIQALFPAQRAEASKTFASFISNATNPLLVQKLETSEQKAYQKTVENLYNARTGLFNRYSAVIGFGQPGTERRSLDRLQELNEKYDGWGIKQMPLILEGVHNELRKEPRHVRLDKVVGTVLQRMPHFGVIQSSDPTLAIAYEGLAARTTEYVFGQGTSPALSKQIMSDMKFVYNESIKNTEVQFNREQQQEILKTTARQTITNQSRFFKDYLIQPSEALTAQRIKPSVYETGFGTQEGLTIGSLRKLRTKRLEQEAELLSQKQRLTTDPAYDPLKPVGEREGFSSAKTFDLLFQGQYTEEEVKEMRPAERRTILQGHLHEWISQSAVLGQQLQQAQMITPPIYYQELKAQQEFVDQLKTDYTAANEPQKATPMVAHEAFINQMREVQIENDTRLFDKYTDDVQADSKKITEAIDEIEKKEGARLTEEFRRTLNIAGQQTSYSGGGGMYSSRMGGIGGGGIHNLRSLLSPDELFKRRVRDRERYAQRKQQLQGMGVLPASQQPDDIEHAGRKFRRNVSEVDYGVMAAQRFSGRTRGTLNLLDKQQMDQPNAGNVMRRGINETIRYRARKKILKKRRKAAREPIEEEEEKKPKKKKGKRVPKRRRPRKREEKAAEKEKEADAAAAAETGAAPVEAE